MSKIDRRSFMRRAAGVMAGVSLANWARLLAAQKAKPNILIILADDATYNDLALYGGQNVKTPNIDRLAEQGMLFTHAYLTIAMCAPCRTELYTGLYPVRNGVCWNHSKALPQTRSICHYLGSMDYRVGVAGKLDVAPEKVFPFEKVEGFESNCVAKTADYECGGIKKFIQRDPKQPFCLVLGLVVPHVVWTVGEPGHFPLKKIKLPPYLADTPQTRQDFARYLAEIEVLDRQVGDILTTLEKSGQADNTMVIFSSEQGAQLPGCKWTNYECGLHTGFIVRWPGRVKPGTRTDALIQYADVLPTLLEAVGCDFEKGDFDGSSFLDVLLGKKEQHREYVYGMHNNIPEGTAYPIRAVRDERYRYIRNLTPERLYIQKYVMGFANHNPYWNSWMFLSVNNKKTYDLIHRYMVRPAEELYDSEQDPYEMKNLADDPGYQDIKKHLSDELDKWMRQQNDPGASLDTWDKFYPSSKWYKKP